MGPRLWTTADYLKEWRSSTHSWFHTQWITCFFGRLIHNQVIGAFGDKFFCKHSSQLGFLSRVFFFFYLELLWKEINSARKNLWTFASRRHWGNTEAGFYTELNSVAMTTSNWAFPVGRVRTKVGRKKGHTITGHTVEHTNTHYSPTWWRFD